MDMDIEAATYLESIVKPLVKQPEDLKIESMTDDRGVLLTLSIARDDMGRVIGKQGDTARAVRRLIRQWGMSHETRIALKINEPRETRI